MFHFGISLRVAKHPELPLLTASASAETPAAAGKELQMLRGRAGRPAIDDADVDDDDTFYYIHCSLSSNVTAAGIRDNYARAGRY